MEFQTETFDYHINWKTRGQHPGQHKSDQRGMGLEFAGHSNLLDYPDPRRIDLRQTIRDPLEQIYVRIFNQRSATPVVIVSDLSASMGFGIEKSKLHFASEISTVIANSVITRSDAIGFIGFNDQTETDWWAPISYRPQRTNLLIEKLKNYQPKNSSHQGIKRVSQVLPNDHTLVFLISDFHMPIDDIEESLSKLTKHTIVPIVIWNKAEYKDLPNFGIMNLNDPESGESTTLFLRKKLKAKIIDKFEQRKVKLQNIFLKYNSPPFFVEDKFYPLAMTQYFNEYFYA
jgi:uncharacterized protein (DUF58 family)|tara:strand:- start:4 stop:864 length:861 start_codon:yes stop_codon:yes gene_type:complete